MPKLLSQSKHEEFKSNSALQIRDQKERRAENARKLEPQEILQAAKISQPAKIASCTHCSPAYHCSPLLLFYAFACLLQFSVSSLFIPCNSFWFWFFYNFPCTEHYISSVRLL